MEKTKESPAAGNGRARANGAYRTTTHCPQYTTRFSVTQDLARHEFIRLAGNVPTAVLLVHLLDCSALSVDGWVILDSASIQRQTGLTRRAQTSARRSLRASGLLSEARRGNPTRLYCRPDLDAIDAALSAHARKERDDE